MSDRWAASIPLDRSAEALRLWEVPGIDVYLAGDRLWLRGDHWSEVLERQLRSMLGTHRFVVDEQGLITPRPYALPVDCLPTGPWTPLTDWFRLAAPPRQFSARPQNRITMRLEPSERVQTCNLLVMPLAAWRDYAQLGPAIRLKRWTFAVSDDRQVAVRGAPSPPLPGAHFVETDGIAVPAGWSWSPALDAAVLRSAFELAVGDVVLLNPDGSHEVIAAD